MKFERKKSFKIINNSTSPQSKITMVDILVYNFSNVFFFRKH